MLLLKYYQIYDRIKDADTIIIALNESSSIDVASAEIGLAGLLQMAYPEKQVLLTGTLSPWLGVCATTINQLGLQTAKQNKYDNSLLITIGQDDDYYYDGDIQYNNRIDISEYYSDEKLGDNTYFLNDTHCYSAIIIYLYQNSLVYLWDDIDFIQRIKEILYLGILDYTYGFTDCVNAPLLRLTALLFDNPTQGGLSSSDAGYLHDLYEMSIEGGIDNW